MRRISISSLVCAVLMAVPTASAAQGLPSDPEADSPSGVVYELPVDRARKDAAPKRGTPQPQNGEGTKSSGGAPGSSDTAGGTSDTSIRSENNFGTSSEVPGAVSKGRDGDNGGGSAEKAAGLAARSTVTGADGPSDGVVFPLLAALLAVGAGIGVFAGRRSLRGRRG